MKLEPHLMALLKLFEESSDGRLESYRLIPELLRGEIHSITWNPNLEVNSQGRLSRISSSITVEYYVHESK